MRDSMSPEARTALGQCRSMIMRGSKSFSLAARLFSPEVRDAAFFLYGWCRFCDDQVDSHAPSECRAESERRLQYLKDATRSAFARERQHDPVFVALQYIAHRYSIPEHYAVELLEGMAMDIRGERYETMDELLLYCYRVAGTVGLMMSHIMGLSDERALKHAADLGIAMQLTNIARDVTEDLEQDRIYLPRSWFAENGLKEAELAFPKNRPLLAQLARRLLSEADRYYRSGDEGLRYLGFRSALAVAAARQVYSGIGKLILKEGTRAWDQRTYVPKGKKVGMVALGILTVVGSIPQRMLRPWSRAPIERVQKFSEVL